MAASKNEHLSLATIIHETFAIIQKSWHTLFLVTAISSLLSFFIVLIFFKFALTDTQLLNIDTISYSNLFSMLGYFALMTVLIFLVDMMATLMLLQILSHNADKTRYTLMRALYNSLERFWPMLILGIFVAILFFIASALTDILMGAIGVGISALYFPFIDIGFSVTTFLSIVVEAIVAMWFIFSPYYLIVEKMGIWDSVRSGFQLVRGRIVFIFLRILLIYILIFGVSVLFNFIPYVGSILTGFTTEAIITTYLFVIFKFYNKQN